MLCAAGLPRLPLGARIRPRCSLRSLLSEWRTQQRWRRHHDPLRVAAAAWKAQVLREDPARQRALLVEAIDILAAHHGASHPEVAARKAALGELSSSMGALNEAQRLFEEASQMLEEELGPHDPEVVCVRKSLAGLRVRIGDYEGARRQFEQVLEIEERYLDSSHMALATTKNDLGNVCVHLGDVRSGKRYVEEALELARAKFRRDQFQKYHPVLQAARRSYDRILRMDRAE